MTVEMGNAFSVDNLNTLRAGIAALKDCTYLNTGGIAPSPSSVKDAIIEAYQWIADHGEATPIVYDEIPCRLGAVRLQLAGLLGADPEEIVLLRNTTEGLNTIARGFMWKPGDEVVLSDQENPAALLPYANLMRRFGVVVRRLKVTDDTDEVLLELAKLVNPQTRLIVLSHVTCVTGLVLPFEQICAIAQSAGVPILWDGAQATGQVPVNLRASGCDFYAGCGYKWLMGPFGTGYLYVRRDWLNRLDTVDIGVGSQETLDLDTLSFRLKATAERFEYGARAWPLYLGLAAGIHLIQQVGLDCIRATQLKLANYARLKLQSVPGVINLSSQREERASGLLTVAIPGTEAEQLVRQLWAEHRVLVQWRYLPPDAPAKTGIRFSLAFFTTEEEIDYALQSLQRVLGR